MNDQKERTKQRCVIYCRVSSVKQTVDGSGLSSQERNCREYAEKSGYEITDVYRDVVSGKERNRPGMNALLADLRRSKKIPSVVVVDDITRFARHVATHTELREELFSYNAKLESPTQKFGEDAGSRFVETIYAAIAEHDRRKNAEQSHSRAVSRMKGGFYVFNPPNGYRYEKAPGGGKNLVPDQPVASIVAEALEGFATGRFQTQVEVQRFLESKPDFPKGPDGRSVKIDRVTLMLTQILYAGYIEYERWGVPLTKARHEALVSYETYLIINDRLKVRKIAPARKDIDGDFPLRGFLVCGSCGYSITSCWSRSHTGVLYPYYLCHHKKCVLKRKSTPRDKLEHEFAELLKGLTPSAKTVNLSKKMFTEAWNLKQASAKSDQNLIERQAKTTDAAIGRLLDSLVKADDERMVASYENKIAELTSTRAELEEKLEHNASIEPNFEEMFELAMQFLASPYELWENGGTMMKRVVLRLAFAKPLVFDHKIGVRTPETTFPFKLLRELEGFKNAVVRAVGLEPTRG